MVLSIESGIT